MIIPQDAKIFRPQPGAQTQFLSSSADYCIYGGQAGGGKTYALCLEALRYHKIPKARVLVFRRQSKDIENAGGLWDEMSGIYPAFGGVPNKQMHTWTFPQYNFQIQCAHLNTEADKYNFKGAQQLVAALFDELTDFTQSQFWYIPTRGRNTLGIRFYVRCSTNPAPGWVYDDFIQWYIGSNGLVIPERAGVTRYFFRQGDHMIWGATPEEVVYKSDCDKLDVKSFQFIPAGIQDNKILMESNGREYISQLKSAGEVEMQRLLYGNWHVKKEGKIFKQSEFMLFVNVPATIDCKIMVLDTASKTKESNDYTVMQVWARSGNKIYLLDQLRGRYQYAELKVMFQSFVLKHQKDLNMIWVEDTSNGTPLIQELKRECPVPIMGIIRDKDKFTRAYAIQGYVAAGHVFLNPVAEYYTTFISEIVSFCPEGDYEHDDQADCLFDAVDKLLINPSMPVEKSNNSRYSNLLSPIS